MQDQGSRFSEFPSVQGKKQENSEIISPKRKNQSFYLETEKTGSKFKKRNQYLRSEPNESNSIQTKTRNYSDTKNQFNSFRIEENQQLPFFETLEQDQSIIFDKIKIDPDHILEKYLSLNDKKDLDQDNFQFLGTEIENSEKFFQAQQKLMGKYDQLVDKNPDDIYNPNPLFKTDQKALKYKLYQQNMVDLRPMRQNYNNAITRDGHERANSCIDSIANKLNKIAEKTFIQKNQINSANKDNISQEKYQNKSDQLARCNPFFNKNTSSLKKGNRQEQEMRYIITQVLKKKHLPFDWRFDFIKKHEKVLNQPQNQRKTIEFSPDPKPRPKIKQYEMDTQFQRTNYKN